MIEVAKGVEWVRVYFVRGVPPKGMPQRTFIKDPPCSGWSHVFLIRGDRRSRLLCPFTLQAFDVPNTAREVTGAIDASFDFRPEFMEQLMRARWAECVRRGWQRDYDETAGVMKMLGWEVPTSKPLDEQGEVKVRGGKDTETGLKKPVKANGKRGVFLRWFLESDGTRSVRDAMLQFDTTRSNVLSYAFMLNKDHGIGYTLAGDALTIKLPAGCVSPFDDGSIVGASDNGQLDAPIKMAEVGDGVIGLPDSVTETTDDDWLDGGDSADSKDEGDSWLD